MTWIFIILVIAIIVVSIIYWKIAIPIIVVLALIIAVWLILAKRKEQEEERAREEESAKEKAKKKRLIADLENFDDLPENRQEEVYRILVNHNGLCDNWSWVTNWLKGGPMYKNKMSIFSVLPKNIIQEYSCNDILQNLINEFNALDDSESGFYNCILFLKQNWNPEYALKDYQCIRGKNIIEYVDIKKNKEKISLDINPLCRYVAKHLKGTGIEPIDCDDMIVDRPCYLKSEIRSVNQRQKDGKLYYDIKNAQNVKLYVFDDTVELMDNSHWRINIPSILDIKVDDRSYPERNDGLYYILSITCQNRGNIFLLCDAYNAAMIQAVIPQVKRRNIKGEQKKADETETYREHETAANGTVQPEVSVLDPAVLPWIGPDYIEGIAGKKVMIVGDCRCQDVQEWNTGYVADVIGKKYLSGNTDIPAYNGLTNIGKAIAGKVLSDEEKAILWNRLAFVNFFQEPVADLRNVSDGQVESGQNAFMQVLEKYAPDRIIACEPLYGYLPDKGHQGPEVRLSSPWKDGKLYSTETWIYPLPYGRKCMVMPIANPGGGFPWDYWHELIIEFLK